MKFFRLMYPERSVSNSAQTFLKPPALIDQRSEQNKDKRPTHLLSVERRSTRHLINICKRFDHNTGKHINEDVPEQGFSLFFNLFLSENTHMLRIFQLI